jgi:hypothetical protein
MQLKYKDYTHFENSFIKEFAIVAAVLVGFVF